MFDPVVVQEGATNRIADRSGLSALAERVRPVALAREQRLEVIEPLAPLLPGGLRRGSTVAVRAGSGVGGATCLALALAVQATVAGSWAATLGLGSVGLVAAAEVGVDLGRLVLVASPGVAQRATVAATLVDGFDLVLLDESTSASLRPAENRRLVARARERGAVVVRVGARGSDGADVVLEVCGASWEGLGEGHGHLRARRATVIASGRGEAARVRRAELWLPGPAGAVETVLEEPATLTCRAHPAVS